MNFTEISELTDILSHSRSFCQLSFHSFPKRSHQGNYPLPHNLNFISVDELINSSFTELSPYKRPNLSLLNLRQEEEETIEKIMTDINQTIIPIFTLSIDMRKKSKELNKPMVLICSSPSLKDLKNHSPKPLKIRRATTLYEERTEESPEKTNKKKISIGLEEELEKLDNFLLKSEGDLIDNKEEFEAKEKISDKKSKKSMVQINEETEKKEDSFEKKGIIMENIEKLEKNEVLQESSDKFQYPPSKFQRKNYDKIESSKRLPSETTIRSLVRKNTIMILTNSSRKFFEKKHESEFLEDYHEKINGKSLLSESLLNKVLITF